MATQTTICPNVAGRLKTKMLLAFEGVTSPTNDGLARNINQVHTLITNPPFSDPLNACGRVKDSLLNRPAADQYRLELNASQDSETLEYFWQLVICLNMGTDSGPKEIIIFRTNPQSEPLVGDQQQTTWTRKTIEPGTNLDFSLASISLNYTEPPPLIPEPTASNFQPAQNETVPSPVTLSWDGTFAAYDVQFGTGDNLEFVSQGQPGRTYDAGALTDGETYWYRITGIRSDGGRVPYQWIQFRVGVGACTAANFAPTGLVDETTVDLTWDGDCALWDVYFGPPGNLSLVAQDISVRTVQVNVSQCQQYEWYVVGKGTTPQVFPTQALECVTDRGYDIGFDEGFGLTSCAVLPNRGFDRGYGEGYGPA